MRNNNDSKSNEQAFEQQGTLQSDGIDVEFSMEQADEDDLEALARSQAADERAKNRKKQ